MAFPAGPGVKICFQRLAALKQIFTPSGIKANKINDLPPRGAEGVDGRPYLA